MLASSLLPVLLCLLAASPSSARRSHGKRASSSSHLISQSVDSHLTNTRRRMDLVVEAKRATDQSMAPLVRPRMDIIAERHRTALPPAQVQKRQTVSKRCKVRPSAAALAAPTTAASPSVVASSSAVVASASVVVPNLAVEVKASSSVVYVAPTTTAAALVATTAAAQTEAAATTTKAAVVVAAAGELTSPPRATLLVLRAHVSFLRLLSFLSGWPTITQAGAIPSATATSASGPFFSLALHRPLQLEPPCLTSTWRATPQAHHSPHHLLTPHVSLAQTRSFSRLRMRSTTLGTRCSRKRRPRESSRTSTSGRGRGSLKRSRALESRS